MVSRAELAAPGSMCALHPTVAAGTVCARCGAFMCVDCSKHNLENLCPRCRSLSAALDVATLAKAYRTLVLCFGAQLLLSVFRTNVKDVPVLALITSLLVLATFVAQVIFAYRTAVAIGSKYAVLWAIAMCLPCANIITLLALSSVATRVCRENGVEVGFLGPKV